MLKTIANQTLIRSRQLCKIISPTNTRRSYAAPLKRFYKNTSVIFSDNHYEITLDHRKLKTPSGKPFLIKNEALAIAVAAEWDAQLDTINRPHMHLTALISTALDNPNHLSKQDMVSYLVNYMATDAVLFQDGSHPDLCKMQGKEWDPIIEWFNDRYEVDIKSTQALETPAMSQKTIDTISKHLMSYDDASVFGFVFATDTIKSLILTLACIDRHISVERAVHLARLEEEFQLGYWGRVEWAHDLNQQDLQARMAAAVLFVYLNSTSILIKQKSII